VNTVDNYALVNIEDDGEDCYVRLYETEELAIEALKKELIVEIWPETEEMKQQIIAAKTYQELEEMNDYFPWGENDMRMYWIVKVRR
jgi:lipopolysaccharide biosynthesis regulator YciM